MRRNFCSTCRAPSCRFHLVPSSFIHQTTVSTLNSGKCAFSEQFGHPQRSAAQKAHFPRSTDQNSTFSRFSHSATIAVDSAPRFHKRLTWCFYFYNLPDDAHSNQLAWKMCFFGIAALRISLPLPKKHIFQNSHHRFPCSILRGSLTTPNRKLNVSPAGKLCCEFHPMRPAGRERRESSRTPDATGTRGHPMRPRGRGRGGGCCGRGRWSCRSW